jgi:hypothetical protein
MWAESARALLTSKTHERDKAVVNVSMPLEDMELHNVRNDLRHKLDRTCGRSDHGDALAREIVVVAPAC